MKVMIDPGHGGKDPGAVSKPLVEKELNYQLANILFKRLEEDGHDVKMTRLPGDFVGLTKRARIANNWDADVFISVHHNSYKTDGANGFEVLYYPGTNPKGKELAMCLCDFMSRNYPHMRKRGAKPRKNVTVIKKTTMPAILIEAGFVSSTKDRRIALLDETQRRVFYTIIAEGVSHVLKP